MPSTVLETRFAPSWLHAWSVLTAAATVVLLALGAVVTTFQVGMADPVWPTMPWHLAFIDWSEPNPGFIIEHVHRLAGSVIGTLVLVLTVWLWLREPRRPLRMAGLLAISAMIVSLALCFTFVDRGTTYLTNLERWLCGCCVLICLASVGFFLTVAQRERRTGLWFSWLGIVVLTAIIFQGLLGGFRVKFNALFGTNLAVIHGCFAQIVFSLLVTLAVITSARFATATFPTEEAPRLRLWSLVLTTLVFLQLVWGALVRHTNGTLAQRLHFLTAFAVVAVAVWFARLAWTSPAARRVLGRTLILLGVLLTLQVMLGVESWMGKFAGVLLPELQKPSIGQAATRVAHVLVGSFILATSVVLTVLLHRPATVAECDPLFRDASEQRETGITTIVQQLEGSV